MLRPDESTAGSLTDAVGQSLLLPRGGHEEAFLITGGEEPVALMLGEGDRAFIAFPSQGNDAWKGLLIAGVSIELDEASAFDPEGERIPLGSLIREGTRLSAIARPPQGAFMGGYTVPLLTELPACAPRMQVGFKRWCITIGQGLDRRELRRVESQ